MVQRLAHTAAPAFRRHSLALAASTTLALCAVSAALAPQTAQAQAQAPSEVRSYAIPAGPLEGALARFAQESRVMLSYTAADIAGRRSAGLSGNHAAPAALDALLAGSGLAAHAQPNGGYALRPLPEVRTSRGQAAAGAEAGLPAVMVTDTRIRDGVTEGSDSYTSGTVTLGKTAQALKDIPQSVSVLTRQRMDDQGMTNLPDAIHNATGMVAVQGVGAGLAINARGFAVDSLQYDGLPFTRNTYSLGNWEQESLVFYDRVEILRGAAGLLQGAGSPGGAINLVRKRPGRERSVVFTGKLGSHDHYGLQMDASTPLNTEGTLRGRVVLDGDYSHGFTEYTRDRVRNIYAALDYDISASTTVGLAVGQRHSRSRPMIVGLPRFADGSDIGLPRSTYTGAMWNRAGNDQNMLFADLEHRFNADWRFKMVGMAMNEKNTNVHQRVVGPIKPDGSGMSYGDFGVDFNNQQRGLDMSLSGRFKALGMEQEVLLGANYDGYTTNDRYVRAWTAGGNIFDIDHNRPWQDMDSIAARGVDARSNYDITQKGLYGTWRVRPTQALTLIAGGRLGWYDFAYRAQSGDSATSKTTGRFIPYAGAVYALNDNWSLYSSYSTVFEPQTARTVQGDLIKPVQGRNYEAGIKGEMADGRLNMALAVFRYEHKNRAVNDYDSGFACDDWYCSRSSGKVRSQGLEAEISGKVATGLELAAGYTYNTTRYLSDPDYQGQIFNTWTPRHMLRLWGSYRLPGELGRWTVGTGVNAQTDTLSSDRAFRLAGFALWNARVAYQVSPELSVALNVSNLLDKRYYVPSYNTVSGNNYYGAPRSLLLTLRYAPRI